MNFLRAFVLALTCLGGHVFANSQDLPIESQGDLRFFVDLAAFRGPAGYVRQEAYLLLDAQQLALEETDEGLRKITLVAVVTDTLGNRVDHRTWVKSMALDKAVLPGLGALFRERVGFDLKPGTYRLFWHVRDGQGDKQGTCQVDVTVADFEKDDLMFSDLQLASTVVRSGQSGVFVKHGWQVVPNVTRRFVTGDPVGVYFELYNFAFVEDGDSDSFILGYRLTDVSGQTVRTYDAKRFLKPGESCVKAELLATEGLAEGPYRLCVDAFDGHKGETVHAERAIFLVSKTLPEGLTQVQKDLLHDYANIQYVADNQTLRAYALLVDWPERWAFLAAFWKGLDETPATATNERLLEHLLRYRYADNQFGAGPNYRGSNTDKGRVYIQHGAPDDVLYQTAAAGGKPYEIWVYETQRRVEFVFVDRRGMGVFELVHSTFPGEISNPYWQQGF